MNIESTLHDKSATITLSGRMDAAHSTTFETTTQSLIAQGATHIIADLTQLTYVSSQGLGAFLAVAKLCTAAGGALLLVNLKGFVKQVFDITRVTPLFRTFDSVDQARQSIP